MLSCSKWLSGVCAFGATSIVAAKNRLVHPGEFLLSQSFLLVVFFIFIELWSKLYKTSLSIDGYTLTQILTYLVVTETLMVSMPQIWRGVQADVRHGDISIYVVRPIGYVVYQAALYMGETVVRVPSAFVFSIALVMIRLGHIALSINMLWWFVLSVSLALFLNFAFEILIGLSSFWVEDSTGWYLVLSMFRMMGSGMLLPFQMMPHWLGRILLNLPFGYVLYGPAKIAVTNHVSGLLVSRIIGGQVVWILILTTIVVVVSRAGNHKLAIYGG